MIAALLLAGSLVCQVPVIGAQPSPKMGPIQSPITRGATTPPGPRPGQAGTIPGQGLNLVNSPLYQYVAPWGLRTPGIRYQLLVVPSGKFVDVTPIGAVGRYVIEVP